MSKKRVQPVPTRREQLETLDFAERQLIGIPDSDPRGQTARKRARNSRNVLAAFYSQDQNVPRWAAIALGEAEDLFKRARENGEPAPEGADAEVKKINATFDKTPKNAPNLRSLKISIIKDAKTTFIVNGEVLRKRLREVIDPSAANADLLLGALGVRTLAPNDGSRDWLATYSPVGPEVLSGGQIATAKIDPELYPQMQKALWQASFTVYARIATAEYRYEQETAALELATYQSPGLT